MERYELRLFGPFRLVSPEGREIRISSQKSRALIAFLATSPRGERERKPIRELLWERSGPAEQRTSLSQELKTIRRALSQAGADSLLVVDRRTVRIDMERLSLGLPCAGDGTRLVEPELDMEFLEGLDFPGYDRWSQWLAAKRASFTADMVARPGSARGSDAAYGSRVPSAGELLGSARPSRPPKPSVAVLPFATHSSEDEILGLALADGLSIRLAHFPQIFVAGSASAAAMARMGLLREEIAGRLGVRYTIDGLILRFGDRLRVSVALVDSDSGEQVWGEVFTDLADGTGAFEQRMVDRIAPQLWSKIDISERHVSMQRIGVGSSRYEEWWRASALYRSFRKEDVLGALAIAETLIKEDGTCPFSTSLAAFLTGLGALLGYCPDASLARERVERHCGSSLSCAPDNPEILGYCAGAYLLVGLDLEPADVWIDRALHLLPTYQPTLFWGGWIDVASGRPTRARERLELALRVNPATGVRGPTLCGIGTALLLEGQPAQALALLREARASDPGFPMTDVALLMAATAVGDRDEAIDARNRLSANNPMRFIRLLRVPGQQAILASLLNPAGRSVEA